MRIDHYVHSEQTNKDIECKLNKLIALILVNNENLEIIMATVQELKAKVEALQGSLDAEQQEILDAIAALEQSIVDLQALVANGGTAEERQAIADQLDAIKADLEGTVQATSSSTSSTSTETTAEPVL